MQRAVKTMLHWLWRVKMEGKRVVVWLWLWLRC